MKTTKILLWPAAALLGFSSVTAQAVPSLLFDYGINLNDGFGVYYPEFDTLPAFVDVSQYEDINGPTGNQSGQGTITATYSGATMAGANSFDAWFDIDLGASSNPYPFNEVGYVTGAPAAGQSWEIDDDFYGNILTNLDNSTFDNTNSVDAIANEFQDLNFTWGMGFDFTLAANEDAILTLTISDVLPTSGFYLTQSNGNFGDLDYNVYLSGDLAISCAFDCTPPGGTNDVPEPSILMLMGIGLAGLVANRRKKVA